MYSFYSLIWLTLEKCWMKNLLVFSILLLLSIGLCDSISWKRGWGGDKEDLGTPPITIICPPNMITPLSPKRKGLGSAEKVIVLKKCFANVHDYLYLQNLFFLLLFGTFPWSIYLRQTKRRKYLLQSLSLRLSENISNYASRTARNPMFGKYF